MKKVLIVATVFKFLSFEETDMNTLKQMGFEIHTATNMKTAGWLKDDGTLDYLDIKKHQIDFARKPFSKQNIVAYKQLKKLLSQEKFELIHCHTPVAATILRGAAIKAKKRGTKIIYTSHGFHFHHASGIKSWFIYYPIEYIMAFCCDMIITINKEDYNVVQKFHTKQKKYIPGVGVDVKHIMNMQIDKNKVRSKFQIPPEAFLILSVGELSERKNHKVIIKAIAQLRDPEVYYLICGTGNQKEYLEKLADKCGIRNQVIFAGQQQHEEVLKLGHAADIGALPSLIEGLGLTGIEILSAGKPIIASGVHGIKDYVVTNQTGICCSPYSVEEFKNAIEILKANRELYVHCCEEAPQMALKFDIDNVKRKMEENYRIILCREEEVKDVTL